ncbi:MAG: 2-phosphosulfolactate phosphatase [Bacteroidetes bacterium]|nr:2-phosphosulfolactate phosphatase [Bacteroidota bacterium]
MEKQKIQVEVCFTPAIYAGYENPEAIVVVVDVLRATSAICTAFMNGANRIIPVATLEEARAFKEKGYLVAAERDGIVKDFADFGNSPYNFTPERVKNNDIVYSTTNGTNSIQIARNSHEVLIGAYLNISALAYYLIEKQRDVIILCAGWKTKFNLEDSLFAGALANKILANSAFSTICDSAKASVDLWQLAENNLMAYIKETAQYSRLRKNNLHDVIEYCHTPDQTNIIPVFRDDAVTVLN